MNFSEVRNRYAAGESPCDVIAGIYQKIIAWNDPAMFLHLPGEEELLGIARQVEALPRELPLWGIPFVVKDNIDVAGWPTTAACPDFSYVPDADAEVVRLLREAGAIPIAKANLDQFATGLVGTRSPFGICRSVFNPEYISGGSSSGSAGIPGAAGGSRPTRRKRVRAIATTHAGTVRSPASRSRIPCRISASPGRPVS